MYRTDFRTLWEKARLGCSERTALKQVYNQGWNRPPAQAGCMRQVLRAGALGKPSGMGWGGRWEGGSGWGTHVNPWLIHITIWQKVLQYCKVISLQLIKINGKKKHQSVCACILRHFSRDRLFATPCSLSGSSVHGILHRDWICISYVSCTGGRLPPPGKPPPTHKKD